jgi:hypothetical protein
VSGDSVGFFSRVWIAWSVYFRVLFDGGFASRVRRVAEGPPEDDAPVASLPPRIATTGEVSEVAALEEEIAELKKSHEAELRARVEEARDEGRAAGAQVGRDEGALLLLGLLQADGRLVDFLQQDVASFDDADIGAAARVVHEGCKKALAGRVEVAAIFSEKEGAKVDAAAADLGSVKLIGAGAKSGVLKHKGWRATTVKLPTPTKDFDARVLARAEIDS